MSNYSCQEEYDWAMGLQAEAEAEAQAAEAEEMEADIRNMADDLRAELLTLLVDYELRKFGHLELIEKIINLFRKYKEAI